MPASRDAIRTATRRGTEGISSYKTKSHNAIRAAMPTKRHRFTSVEATAGLVARAAEGPAALLPAQPH